MDAGKRHEILDQRKRTLIHTAQQAAWVYVRATPSVSPTSNRQERHGAASCMLLTQWVCITAVKAPWRRSLHHSSSLLTATMTLSNCPGKQPFRPCILAKPSKNMQGCSEPTGESLAQQLSSNIHQKSWSYGLNYRVILDFNAEKKIWIVWSLPI